MYISNKKNPELCLYGHETMSHVKELQNTALFLERNVMTGLKKDPADRHPLENEAIDTVIKGINKHNKKVVQAREDFLLSPAYIH